MWKIIIKEESSVATPVGTGKHTIYVDSVSGKIKKKDAAGNEEVVVSEDSLVSIFDSYSFWDWSDWDVVITTTVTLARDMYYNNLAITSPWILNPNGYKIYVKWTLSGNGTINRNWNNASWQTWWAALNQWTLNAEAGAWGNGGSDSVNGWDWVAANPSFSNQTWARWWNSYQDRRTGGAWGISTRWALYNIAYSYERIIRWILNPATFVLNTTYYKWIGSSWGGAWSTNVSPSCVWGGAWGNGWVIWISAYIINFTWTITATWWTWAASSNPANMTAWGWAGGSGGCLIYIYKTLTSIWTVTLTGWVGWAWYNSWENWKTWEQIWIAI